MSKRGGFYCAYEGCNNVTGRNPKISFFSFPKDPERQAVWIKNCNKLDLLGRPSQHVHKNYKICSRHFSGKMFLNDLRNRLYSHAVPIPVIDEENNPEGEPNRSTSMSMKVEECRNTEGTPVPSTSAVIQPSTSKGIPGPTTGLIGCQHASTQTPRTLTAYTSRKNGLRNKLKSLRSNVNALTHNGQQQAINENKKDMTFEEFENVLHQFLPANIVAFVLMQAKQYEQRPKGRR